MATTEQRWRDVNTVLRREGPFVAPGFDKDDHSLQLLADTRVLVIGAGGLGCDILKCLALSGFAHIDVIDMDTIDPSNLNRQFLFRAADINKPKATTAAAFINKRVAGCHVTGHLGRIQDKGPEFYRQFKIIICGLDNVAARRWINAYVHSMVEYEDMNDEDGNRVPDADSIIFLVDSGTEGFKGNWRVVIPSISSCIDCNVELFPPEVKVPICTIAATPRNVAHCIQWAGLIHWTEKLPFGEAEAKYDCDNPDHMAWVLERARERAAQFNVTKGGPLDLSKTLGVLKNIIPAIASTNALIAAAAASEAMKIVTSVSPQLDNYVLFNAEEGTFSSLQHFDRNPACEVCGNPPRSLVFERTTTVGEALEYIMGQPQFGLQNPRLLHGDGVLYMRSNLAQLRALYEDRLGTPLSDHVAHGDILSVDDDALPNCSLSFEVSFRAQ